MPYQCMYMLSRRRERVFMFASHDIIVYLEILIFDSFKNVNMRQENADKISYFFAGKML